MLGLQGNGYVKMFCLIYFVGSLTQEFFCVYCKIFKSTYLEEHLRAAASHVLSIHHLNYYHQFYSPCLWALLAWGEPPTLCLLLFLDGSMNGSMTFKVSNRNPSKPLSSASVISTILKLDNFIYFLPSENSCHSELSTCMQRDVDNKSSDHKCFLLLSHWFLHWKQEF